MPQQPYLDDLGQNHALCRVAMLAGDTGAGGYSMSGGWEMISMTSVPSSVFLPPAEEWFSSSPPPCFDHHAGLTPVPVPESGSLTNPTYLPCTPCLLACAAPSLLDLSGPAETRAQY